MNKLIIYRSLIHSKKENLEYGFTLIELIVVMIIIGILSVIALPNTIKQVAKAREAEGKNNLGILSRAQQAYHFENATFTNSINDLLSNSLIQSKYYTFPNPSVADAFIVKHQAVSIDPTIDQVRDFAIGIYFNSGAYNVAVCQASDVSNTVDVPDAVTDPCTNSGDRIR